MRISDWSSDVCSSDLLVRFSPGSDFAAPNLRAVLADPARLKIYHFARFDLAAIRAYLGVVAAPVYRSEEHTSELQSLMRISYAVFCLKQKIKKHTLSK